MKYIAFRYGKTFLMLIAALTIQSVFIVNKAKDYNFSVKYFSGRDIRIENDSILQNEYNKIIREALDYQLIADSLTRLAKQKRTLLQETNDPHKRIEIISEISKLEKESDKYQEKADAIYNNSFIYNVSSSKTDTMEEKIRLVSEVNGIKIYQYVPAGYNNHEYDSIQTLSVRDKGKTSPVQDNKPGIDQFDILEISPYNDFNPIPSEIKIPDGLVFRIQMGVYSKPVPNNTFKGLSPMSSVYVSGKIKYFTGIFYSSNSANKALNDIREYGFPDAFIVSFYNGKTIKIEKAKEIEYSQIKL